TRAARLGIDLLADLEESVDVRGPALGEAAAGLRVGGDRAQRLIDLVSDAGRHLAHEIESVDLRKTQLERARMLLGVPLPGKVPDDRHEPATVVALRFADREGDG